MVRAATFRVSRPVRPACWAEASSRTPTSRPGLGRSAYLRPRTVAPPDVAGVSPTMTRMVVDFPAPFGPRNPVTRPGWAVKETLSTARRPPYVLVSAVTSIMATTLSSGAGRPHRGAVPSHPLPDPEKFSGSPLAAVFPPSRQKLPLRPRRVGRSCGSFCRLGVAGAALSADSAEQGRERGGWEGVLIEIWSDVVCPWCYIGKRHL